MTETFDYIETVGQITAEIEALGATPVLIGGMALVILGSRRVTKDFDFLVSTQARGQEALLKIFYQKGFELASRVDAQGNITATIDNQKIASVRLRLDSPSSAYFLNRKTGLRIDLLFDFPLPVDELIPHAQTKKIRSHTLYIASKADLLRLKKIAFQDRGLAADAQDLEFLKQL